MSSSFVSVLKYKNFSKIWISQVTSQIALHMLNFALLLRIYELTKSTTSVSLVLIASALPSVIFGSFSGVIADRLNYKKILVYTNLLRFIAIMLLFVLRENILGILEIIFLISLITQFFAPAENSSIPLIIPEKKLVTANSVIVTTMYGTLLVGYSIAGPIMKWFSPEVLFLVCGLLYLIATWSIENMTNYDNKTEKKISISRIAKDIENIWYETKHALSVVSENKKIFSPMIKLTIGWGVFGSFIILMPSFGEQVLDISPKFIGLVIVAPAGLGMLIGAYILDKKKSFSISRAINKSFIMVGATLMLFALYDLYKWFFLSRLISVALVVILGLGCSIVYISAQTALHLNSNNGHRGKIFGISTMLINLAMSVPALIIGGLSDITSPLYAMIVVALFTSLYGLKLIFEKPITQTT